MAMGRTLSNILALVALGALLLAAAASGDAAQARRAAPWCAWDPGINNFNCGFYTHQQCMAEAWGNGGVCVPNPRAPYGDVSQRRRR